MKTPQEEMNDALGRLNSLLRERLVDTKKMSIADWNKVIAPMLSKLGMIIDGVSVTARTFKLPENYFD